MTRPPLPSIMGELLQDPNVREWLQARDLDTAERMWDGCLDLAVELLREEGASAAFVTALSELRSRELIEREAKKLLADAPPPRPRVPMEQTEA